MCVTSALRAQPFSYRIATARVTAPEGNRSKKGPRAALRPTPSSPVVSYGSRVNHAEGTAGNPLIAITAYQLSPDIYTPINRSFVRTLKTGARNAFCSLTDRFLFPPDRTFPRSAPARAPIELGGGGGGIKINIQIGPFRPKRAQ